MICDFFYPNFGGVENHVYYLSQCLLQMGHRVIVVTHTYGGRQGIRWLRGGLKVYHLPFPNFIMQTSFPTLWMSLPFYYDLFLRERVDLVHGHSAFSSMCEEGIIYARTMEIPCVFTDHSLFGFADVSSILINKLLKFVLSDVQRTICVSHTSRENTVLRGALDPQRVHVIPNAILVEQFTPKTTDSANTPKATDNVNTANLTVIVLSRLVYRKGIDLLLTLIPAICKQFPFVDFVVAGDGPKKIDLEQMRERHQLHKRVSLLGAIGSDSVREVLVRGQIFLNTSLTEAFCMAIVEAAACNLFVVSTRVGGVPEVLPPDMLRLAEPTAADLTRVLGETVEDYRAGRISSTDTFHDRIKEMYSWQEVAARTARLYTSLAEDPVNGCMAPPTPLVERLRRIWGTGAIAGKYLCIAMIWCHFYYRLLKWLHPPSSIEPAMRTEAINAL